MNHDEDESERFGITGKFRKVPIEETQNNSIEIYNVYSGLDLSKVKFKKKVCKIIFIILIIVIIFTLVKTLNLTQKIANITKIEDYNNIHGNNDDDHDDDHNDDDYKYRKELNEYFYTIQKKDKIDLNSFSSPQLRKPKNIKLIKKLKISLDLEYEKFIHLKIKDADKERWEVPEKDVLDKEYILNREDNKVAISENLKFVDSQIFYIELLSNDTNYNFYNNTMDGNDPDDVDDMDKKEKENEENYDVNENFGFKIMTQESEEIFSFSTTKNFIFSDTYINFESKLTSNNIYGFGERTHDFKLNEGTYTIWPHDCEGTKYDDGFGGLNEYGHQPIGLHKTKYEDLWLGFVFLNTNAQDVVIHSNNNNTYLTHRTIGGIIDYYIIVNNSPEEVIKNIQYLLGIPPLPPYWSFGYHQSRYGYKSFKDFKEVYEKYKELEIPIDGMWLDIDSFENYEVFTINKKFKKIIPYIRDNIHIDGGKFIPIVDIGISNENKYSPYIKLGEELDIFIKSNYTKKNLIGKVWPGKTVFPDFFHPKISDFWNKGLEDYYKLVNYDGIWLDMNEPTNLLENKNSKCVGEIVDDNECTLDKNEYDIDKLPYVPGYRKNIKETLSLKSISENALIYGNNTIYDTKPMISFYQTKHTYHYLNKHLNKRPFILSRSTSIGSGKYTFHWLGDNYSKFESLKNSISGIFNFNIFGIPFTGSDICGFLEDSTKNLCIRWYNLGVFYPFSRNHNCFSSKDQYPWSFSDENAINIIKKNIKLRYSLLRYMYSQFFLISLNEKGSFFKPLMFEFPNDEASYEEIESKVMFGEAFLICTFFENNEKSKNFKFPNDNFNVYPSGKKLIDYKDDDENKIIELSGNLDEIHIFLRGGFIVPYQNVFDKYILNSQKLRDEKINLIVNIDYLNTSRGEIFFDNDDTNIIDDKNYYRVDMSYSDKRLTFTTYKNDLEEYEGNDHIFGKIEFWRISEIIEMNSNKVINLTITYNDIKNSSETIKGIYDQENDKVVFDISGSDKTISIFNVDEMSLINN